MQLPTVAAGEKDYRSCIMSLGCDSGQLKCLWLSYGAHLIFLKFYVILVAVAGHNESGVC